MSLRSTRFSICTWAMAKVLWDPNKIMKQLQATRSYYPSGLDFKYWKSLRTWNNAATIHLSLIDRGNGMILYDIRSSNLIIVKMKKTHISACVWSASALPSSCGTNTILKHMRDQQVTVHGNWGVLTDDQYPFMPEYESHFWIVCWYHKSWLRKAKQMIVPRLHSWNYLEIKRTRLLR